MDWMTERNQKHKTHLAVRAGDLGEDAHDGADKMEEPHLGVAILLGNFFVSAVEERRAAARRYAPVRTKRNAQSEERRCFVE